MEETEPWLNRPDLKRKSFEDGTCPKYLPETGILLLLMVVGVGGTMQLNKNPKLCLGCLPLSDPSKTG
jgi:hypothetical protein